MLFNFLKLAKRTKNPWFQFKEFYSKPLQAYLAGVNQSMTV